MKYTDEKLKELQDSHEGRSLQVGIWIANEKAEANKLLKIQIKLQCLSGSTGKYSEKPYKDECIKLLTGDELR